MLPADVPDGLARPPYESKRKPFLKDGIDIKGWKVPSLPYLVWAPIEKLPAEKEIIRALKNLAKKADSVVIGTDFDREGELIGSDALAMVRDVAPDVPVSRAPLLRLHQGRDRPRFSRTLWSSTRTWPTPARAASISTSSGVRRSRRYLTMAKFGGFGNVRSAGRVQTPTLALVVEPRARALSFQARGLLGHLRRGPSCRRR